MSAATITVEARRIARLINGHNAKVREGEHVSGGALFIGFDGRGCEWGDHSQEHSSTWPWPNLRWSFRGGHARVTQREAQEWYDSEIQDHPNATVEQRRAAEARERQRTMTQARAEARPMSVVAEMLAARDLTLAMHDVEVFGVDVSPEGKRPGTVEDVEIGLVESGTRRALAESLRSNAMIDVAAWVRAADDAGVPRSRIALLAGVSRQSVYDLVDRP